MVQRSLPYRPEIDGLRAFAVIPVILFHLGFDWIPGGYIGVDIFFVISGFLITSILLIDFDNGVFSFRKFWLRRIRRILPVLVMVVLFTLIFSQSVLYAPDIYYLGQQGLAALFSLANVSQWLTAGNYWGFAAENSPLLHTWSLSLEEQFYVFFPIFIFLILKYFRNYLIYLLLFFSAVSLAVFFYGAKYHPDATFYLLPSRAWELGIGAFLALYTYKKSLKNDFKSNNISEGLSLAGFLIILCSFFLIDGSHGISRYLVIPVIATGFIIVFAKAKNSWVNTILSLPVTVYIGKISYSLYLWHWPVLVLSKNLALRTSVEFSPILLLSIIFVLSILSYHLIETPARKHKKTVPVILSFLFVSAVYSFTLTKTDYREDISMFSPTMYAGELYTSRPDIQVSEGTIRKNHGIQTLKKDNRNFDAYKQGGTIHNYGGGNPEIVVLGDSHALMWANTIDTIAKSLNKSISTYAVEGTPTFFEIPVVKGSGSHFFSAEELYEYNKARLEYLERWKPDTVFIIQSWSNLDSINRTDDLIAFLGKIGSRVILLEQPPELFYGDKNATQFLSYYGIIPNNQKQYVPYVDSESFRLGREAVRKIANKYDYCELIEIADIFIKNDEGWVLDGKDVLYRDEDHLSEAGASKAKQRILDVLKSNTLAKKQ